MDGNADDARLVVLSSMCSASTLLLAGHFIRMKVRNHLKSWYRIVRTLYLFPVSRNFVLPALLLVSLRLG